MPYTPVLATLGYVLSPDRQQVLLIHRNRRQEDAHYGKYNGLGGKLDPGEDVVACMRREILEEVEETDRQFHGVMPYRDGKPVSWSYSLL